MDETKKTEIKALDTLIKNITSNHGGRILESFDLATAIIDAGYRLDPYPNGKTKQELLEIIEKQQAQLDRAKILLREEHEALVDDQEWSLKEHLLNAKTGKIDCEKCKFIAGEA